MPRRRSASNSSGVAALAALGVVLAAGDAHGYCRTSSCKTAGGEFYAGQHCVPTSVSNCGTPLSWASKCIGFSVQQDASAQIDLASAEALMEQAFAAWETADCGGAAPSIGAQNLGPVACTQTEYNIEQGNANTVVFRDAEWPYTGQGQTLALTTVTYDLDTGEIYDADLEVNGTSEVQLTTGDTGVVYDLPSILTHEAGHMLGLAHSEVADATMRIEYVPGDTTLRDLAADDMNAICTTYPPSRSATCEPTPRHGFQSECATPVEDDGCSCRTGARGSTRTGWLALVALGLAVRRRRRA
jgi:MYXO-CTERM domain-containing protein